MQIGGFSGFQCRNGNSCGSASCLRVTNGKGYFLTNAHVAGTKIGHPVRMIGVGSDGADIDVLGTVFAAGYVQAKSVDWAIVIVEGLEMERIRPICSPRLIGPSDDYEGWVTIGSPRCERPSVRRLGRIRDDAPVGYAIPAAISGQSGSGIFDGEFCTGLITWTDGRNTLFQTAEALGQTLDADFVNQLADPRCPMTLSSAWSLPNDAVPACESPVATETGYHGPTSGVVQVLCLAGEGDLLADDADDEASFDWMALLIKLLPLILEFFAERGVSSDHVLEAILECKSE